MLKLENIGDDKSIEQARLIRTEFLAFEAGYKMVIKSSLTAAQRKVL